MANKKTTDFLASLSSLISVKGTGNRQRVRDLFIGAKKIEIVGKEKNCKSNESASGIKGLCAPVSIDGAKHYIGADLFAQGVLDAERLDLVNQFYNSPAGFSTLSPTMQGKMFAALDRQVGKRQDTDKAEEK